jgi:eukaryotic-like serine/threonine-protein kinase
LLSNRPRINTFEPVDFGRVANRLRKGGAQARNCSVEGLLAGSTPFDAKELMASGIDAMRKTIREKEPQRPSTRLATLGADQLTTKAKLRSAQTSKLMHQLKGDLDWIVMKCLEKDRTRRYETANGLAADLKRYLASEPVVARPPSTAYRFQKAWRRNQTAFTASAVVVIALLSGLGVSIWALHKARTQALKSQHVARFLKDMLGGAEPAVAAGRDVTLLREILDKTSERVSTDLTAEPEVELELRTTIGRTYEAAGEYQRAEAMQRQALALARLLYGSKPRHSPFPVCEGKHPQSTVLSACASVLCILLLSCTPDPPSLGQRGREALRAGVGKPRRTRRSGAEAA